MGKTTISWTDRSANPIRARHKVTGEVGWHCVMHSAGCANCYSHVLNGRFGTHLPYQKRSEDDIELFFDDRPMQAILRLRKKGQRIFPFDMTDLFGDFVPDWMIDRAFAYMALAQDHTFQVLTKRADRMENYVRHRRSPLGLKTDECVATEINRIAAEIGLPLKSNCLLGENSTDWLPRNIWMGVSVENQEQARLRIRKLAKIPAAVLFVSAEPLLSAVDLTKIDNGWGETYNALTAEVRTSRGTKFRTSDTYPVRWLIGGGESGRKSRPCNLAWLRSLRDQCRVSGAAWWLKQLGSNPHGDWLYGESPKHTLTHYMHGILQNTLVESRCQNGRWKLRASKGDCIEEWPEDLRENCHAFPVTEVVIP